MVERREIPPVALVSLMEQDGLQIPAGGQNRSIHCPFSEHDDRNASASINVSKGVFNCHGCGRGGNAWTYLTEIRRMPAKDAATLLEEQFGWTDRHVNHARAADEPRAAKEQGRPRAVDAIPDPYRRDRVDASLIGRHEYKTSDGRLVCVVARYDNSLNKKIPKTLPLVPRSPEGWWVCGPKHEQLPEADAYHPPQLPLYRLCELLIQTEAESNRQIWVVEGEKCADAVARTLPNQTVVTWLGGTGRKKETVDWSPVYGHKVLLIADADKHGRRYMTTLGKYLDAHGCTVRYVLPPGETGDDVADVIARGGDVVDWAKSIGVRTHEDVSGGPTKKEMKPALPPLTETPHFEVLGMAESRIMIQSRVTHLIYRFNVGQLMQPGPLFDIAPHRFWHQHLMGDWSAQTREQVADSLLEAARARGQVGDQMRMFRLGALRLEDDAICFNVGDGILHADGAGVLTRRTDLTRTRGGDIFLPERPVDLQDDARAPQWCREFAEAIMRYRWDTQMSGRTFLGWITSSIVGGALPFRPMLWLTAPADSGKTWLFSTVLSRFFGPLLREVSDASAAGLAAAASRDSLPIYMDEFEPGRTTREVERFEDILKMVRLATSGGGGRVRGTQQGGLVTVQPRFSVMCASIQQPKLSEADASRFMPIMLSPRPVENWPAVRDALLAALTPEKCLAMRTHIIRHAGRIVTRAREIEDRILTEGIERSTRQAQILSALTAGAEFLSGSDELVRRQRRQRHDIYEPLSHVLSMLVRRPGGDVALSEAVRLGYFRLGKFVMRTGQDREFTDLCERYGIRMVGQEEMWIAPSTPALQEVIRQTKWAGIDFGAYLATLPGATRLRTSAGAYVRMKAGGTMRTVVMLDGDTLAATGFDPSDDVD